MPERAATVLLLALVALLPFEPLATLLGLSLLQWLFLGLLAASLPGLWSRRRALLRDPVCLAGLALVVVSVASALLGVDPAKAARGVARLGAGVLLLAIARTRADGPRILTVWSVAAVVAAVYALVDFSGVGVSGLFRSREFYLGTARRLSGSFEYPNVAAAYFAISLPIVWSLAGSFRRRLSGAVLSWIALVLTFSRGAAAAVLVAVVGGVALAIRGSAGAGKPPARSLAAMGLLGVGAYLVLGAFEPLLIDRLHSSPERPIVGAEYRPEYNVVRLEPGGEYQMRLTLRNLGQSRWESSGDRKVVLSYHWYDTVRRRVLPGPRVDNELPRDVGSGEELELVARFRTPRGEGQHLLDWDLRQSGYGWFTNAGVYPGIMEVDLRRGASPSWELGDVSRWYRRGPGHVPALDASVTRSELWTAAIGIFLDRPLLGVGPDNYRRVYGEYLGYAAWDDRIRSNNLYLELLATTGLVGLAAFLAVPALVGWSWWPAGLGAAVFLVHGLVDVFLMTTPIYFGFWILLGLADERRL